MANLIDIGIQARDLTDAAFRSVRRHASDLDSHLGGVFGRLGSAATRLGTNAAEAGSRMSSSLIQAAGGGQQLLLVLAGIVTILPVIAQAASAAIVLGLGGALAGIGIMAAMQAEQVKDAFTDLKEHVSSSITDMAKPFEPVLVNIAGMFKDTFDKLAPSIGRAFSTMAPQIEDFVGKIATALESFDGTIDSITDQFGPLLEVLGNELSEGLEQLSGDLSEVAESMDPRMVEALVEGLFALIHVTMLAIEGFNLMGSALLDLADKIPGVDFAETAAGGAGLEAVFKSATGTAEEFTEGLNGLSEAAIETANSLLSARGSMRSVEAAIDDASDALKKNGKNLDINTEKGRNNQAALDNIASSALNMRDKAIAAGRDPQPELNRARAAFIRLAQGMGTSEAKANALANSLGLIKSKTVTIVTIFKNIGKTNAGIGSGTADAALATKAHGGVSAGGMTWVGEQGPELVDLPSGSRVRTAGDSNRIAGSSGGLGAQALKALTDAIDNKISTIRSKMNSVIAIIKKNFEGSKEDSLVLYAKNTITQLEKLAVKRDKITEKLADSRAYAKNLASSVSGFASLTNLDSARTSVGLTIGLTGRLNKIRAFAKALGQLAKRGLSRSLYRQVAEAGPEEGLALAQDLLEMDKAAFSNINSLQGQIDKAASQIGSSAAQNIFNTSNLEKQEKAIQKSMDRIADKFTDRIADNLAKVGKKKSKNGKAGGGPAGGLTWVGEEGAELVRLPYGSSVIPHSNSMMGNQGSSQVLQIEWVGDSDGDDFLKWLRKNIRIRAGNGPSSVQTALG